MSVEYCGAPHANMRFKTYPVTPANFESWAAHQASPAAFGAVAPAAPTAPAAAATGAASTGAPVGIPANPVGGSPTRPRSAPSSTSANAAPAQTAPAHDMSTMTTGGTVQQAGFVAFPREKLPPHVLPSTPIPPGMTFDESLKGDAERGRALLTSFGGACAGCHVIAGNPSMVGITGPNLTHIGSRNTIAGGIYPNDTKHLSLWIKNARWMKPGVIMPTLGAFQRDPLTGQRIPKTGLTDQQIADVVAYLQALK